MQESKKWWNYKITEEQIKLIKEENGEAIRRFWEENEKVIIAIIKGEIRRLYIMTHNRVELDDCINQVYCDLPTYKYSCSRDITYGIFRSVRFCSRGYSTRSNTISLSTKLGEDFTLEDVLVGKYNIEDCYDYSVVAERLYYKIALMLFPESTEKQSAFLRRI